MKQVYFNKLLKNSKNIWMDVVYDHTDEKWKQKLKSCRASNSDECWVTLDRYKDWLKKDEGTKIYIRKYVNGERR